LSALSEAEIDVVIKAISPRLGAYGDLETDKLLALCAMTQASGYASTGNHAVPGVRAIGLPVFNLAKSPIAAITVAATQSRMTESRIATILPMLRTAVKEVTRLLHQ